MKSVLMIAYHFPPEGSAGTYRSLRFVRQLAKVGWSPAVITADPYSYERYDPDLLNSIPDQVDVIRVRGHDAWQAIQSWRGKRINDKLSATPHELAEQARESYYKPLRSRIRGTIRRIESCYYQPDMARPWIRPAVHAIVNRSKRKTPDVIWATAGPVSAWVVAKRVSELIGVPYVLDLRDPHGLGYYESEDTWPSWVKGRVHRAMYHALKNAQAVVFLFDSVAESYVRAFPGAIDTNRVHIIPNGYEGMIEATLPPKGEICTILYSGTVATYCYDTLLRSLVLLKQKCPEIAKLLRIDIVGEGADAVMQEAASLGLSELVRATGPVPQRTVTKLQRSAHALLLLGRSPTRKGYELVAGAKVFEYLKANRPIIGVLPDDEGKKILLDVGITTIADANSTAEIMDVLETVVKSWSEDTLCSLLPERARCESYSAERHTEALLPALNGSAAIRPFKKGSVEVPSSLRMGLNQHRPLLSEHV